MTVVMQAAPTATGSIPGSGTPFVSVASGAAAADGSPFAAMLLTLASSQPSPAPGTAATSPIVSLEPIVTVAGPPDAPAAPVEVILLDPLDAEADPQDPATLSAQAAVLATQSAAPKPSQESVPILEAAVSEEVVAVPPGAESQPVVVSPDALMPALPPVGEDDELRTNRPSVLTPLSAAATETSGAGELEPALNASLDDVVAQPLTGPATSKSGESGSTGREMQPGTSETPGVVRFDGNASSQTSTAQPAVMLPLPPAETDQPAAQVSILSTFAQAPGAATTQVVVPALTNVPDDESTESITIEELSNTFSTESAAATPPGRQAASAVDITATSDVSALDSIARMAPGEAIGTSPGTSAAVAAPASSGAAARIDGPEGASVPPPPAPASEPAVQHPSVSRIAATVLETLESGGGEARIHLQPRELGDVIIHVRTAGDRVEVMVQAERSEAVNVIRENARDLTGLLGDSGLNLTDLNVSLGMQQGRGGWSDGSSQQPNNRLRGDSEFAATLGSDPVAATTNHNRLRATYNPDGAHLYRV